MRSVRWVLGLLLGCVCTAPAQPLLDREALAKIPLDEAMVLDPVGPWLCWDLLGVRDLTLVTGLDQEGGYPRFAVAEEGKSPIWHRELAVRVDALRYPVVVVAYRASGIQPDGKPVLSLERTTRAPLAILRNRELVADGEIHEAAVDLRDELQDAGTEFTSLLVSPRCQGPEPAVFELLGLRLESDQQLPPLEKAEEAQLTIQALDHSGQPVADATVTADPDWLNTARTATTDAEGKATLAVADTCHAAHSLRLTKPGMAITEIVTDAAGRLSPTAALYPGARYGGVIRNETGAPVPNVAVGVYVALLGCSSRNEWQTSSVLTGADGRWTSPVLPSGRQPSITLEHPEYPAQNAQGLRQDALREQRSEIVLHRGGRLVVRVVGPDGKPVPDAAVHLSREWTPVGEAVRTGPDGTGTFPGWWLGEYEFTVQAPSLALHQTSVEVKPDQAPVEIRLEPGGVIRGRIVDVAGKPVPGVRLVIEHWRNCWGRLWDSTTDTEGRFVWREAPRDEVPVSIGKAGYLYLSRYPLYAGEAEQTIVLPPPLVVRGRITDAETGQPVAGATVVPGLVDVDSSLAKGPPNWRDDQRQKAEDGNYRVGIDSRAGLASLVLRAEADGYSVMTSRTIRFDEEGVVCDLQLRKETALVGTVQLPDGQPAANAKVFLVSPGRGIMVANGIEADPGEARMVTSAADGSYRLSRLPDNARIVALHPAGYREVPASGWKEAPDLALQAWGHIEGQVRLGADPVPNALVSYRPAVDSWPPGSELVIHNLRTTADAQGRFVLPRVPPGKGRIEGTHWSTPPPDGKAVARAEPFELPPGGTLTVDFVSSGRSVMGRIAPPQQDGHPIACGGSHGSLSITVQLDLAEPAPPDFGKDQTSPEARQRIEDWPRSADGKAYAAAATRYHKARSDALAAVPQSRFLFPLAADGTFRLDHVPVGDYELRVFLYPPGRSGLGVAPVGQARLAVAVPEGRSDEPVDLGSIQAEAMK